MNVDGPTNRGRVRGAGRHDMLMLLAAVAIWGVITGSMTMRSGGSLWGGSIAEEGASPVGLEAQPIVDTVPTAEAHLGLVREGLAER